MSHQTLYAINGWMYIVQRRIFHILTNHFCIVSFKINPFVLLISSSDTFTNFETTTFFRESEFVYSFLCKYCKNVGNNIQFLKKQSVDS